MNFNLSIRFEADGSEIGTFPMGYAQDAFSDEAQRDSNAEIICS